MTEKCCLRQQKTWFKNSPSGETNGFQQQTISYWWSKLQNPWVGSKQTSHMWFNLSNRTLVRNKWALSLQKYTMHVWTRKPASNNIYQVGMEPCCLSVKFMQIHHRFSLEHLWCHDMNLVEARWQAPAIRILQRYIPTGLMPWNCPTSSFLPRNLLGLSLIAMATNYNWWFLWDYTLYK